MKKLFVLIVIAAAAWYLYQHTGLLHGHADTDLKETTNKADAAPVGQVSESSPAPSGNVAQSQSNNPQGTELSFCNMLDESGKQVSFGDVLSAYSDRIIVLHINNADRQHCPRGDDKEHFQAVCDLEYSNPGRVKVIGFNFAGTPDDIRAFKSYYGVGYEMYTVPANLSGMEEAQRVQKFYNSLGSINMPLTLFIRNGKYIVKRVSGLSSSEALKNALSEAMGQG